MSSRLLGPKRGASSVGRLRLAARAHDRRPADDDGPGAAVVADRQVAPVREERLRVGTEETPEVRRVLERRVEVDVVGDREREMRRRRVERHEIGASPSTSSSTRASVSSHDERPSARNGLRRRRLEDRAEPGRSEIEDPVADAEADAWRVAARRRTRRSRPHPSRREHPERLELLDRLEEAAAADRVERARAGRARARRPTPSGPARRTTSASRPNADESASARAASSSPSKTTRGEQVQEAVLAVRPHRVVEARGRLEHELALAARADEAGRASAALGAARPPHRTFARSPCAASCVESIRRARRRAGPRRRPRRRETDRAIRARRDTRASTASTRDRRRKRRVENGADRALRGRKLAEARTPARRAARA